MPVALFALHRQQRFQVPDVAVILLYSLIGQGNEVGSHGRHTNGFAVLPHTGVFESLGLVLHWSLPSGQPAISHSRPSPATDARTGPTLSPTRSHTDAAAPGRAFERCATPRLHRSLPNVTPLPPQRSSGPIPPPIPRAPA